MAVLRIEWLDDARADVRALDHAVAMHIFERILHFARTGSGTVMPLHRNLAGCFRLRIGDYRVLFTLKDEAMHISGVRHRSDAYRG